MKNKFTDQEIIDYLEGVNHPQLLAAMQSDNALMLRVEEFRVLLSAIDMSKAYSPPESISETVQRAIVKEKLIQSRRRSAGWQLAAAMALLFIGYFVGRYTSPISDESAELKALAEEVTSLKHLTLEATLKPHSASERIEAVGQIQLNKDRVTPRLVSTLIKTLNTDPSPNVRYEALQALSQFIDQENVKIELAEALLIQKDPLIQISLISILLEVSEKRARRPIEQLIEDRNTTEEVRRQAKIALQVLS